VEIWSKDEGVLDTQLEATHEEQSSQPAGTKIIPILYYETLESK